MLAGPFAGLRLPADASWGGSAARLAGTYELEVAGLIEDVVRRRPPLIVDVGAAEGYYSLGLARALPDSRVLSYDIDPAARRLCSAGVASNGLSNIDVRGRVTPAELQRRLVAGAFVLSDCEGYELELLDPVAVPALREALMLVELHEFVAPGLTETVLARFAATHCATVIDARPRTSHDAPHLRHLAEDQVDRVLDEGRPTDPHPMQWAFLVPR